MANNGTNADPWHKFIADGENPSGFRAVTPNGTASDRGDGQNQFPTFGTPINGSRWTLPDPGFPQGMSVPPTRGKVGSGVAGNRNRTAE